MTLVRCRAWRKGGHAGPGETTTFTPSGNVGGLVTVFAGLNDRFLERQVKAELVATQNGPNNTPTEQAQIATDVRRWPPSTTRAATARPRACPSLGL
ncbi:MAG TPA: hypothetical protein ENK57_11405, partial [Polyangiaceae bacterium]|nr:hypothetical protein [Polyangiaceae bacterium]